MRQAIKPMKEDKGRFIERRELFAGLHNIGTRQ